MAKQLWWNDQKKNGLLPQTVSIEALKKFNPRLPEIPEGYELRLGNLEDDAELIKKTPSKQEGQADSQRQ